MSHHLTGSYLIAGQPGTSVAGLVLISHHLIAVEALAGQLSDGAAGVACKRMSCHHPCLQCSAEYLLYQAQVDLLCLGLSDYLCKRLYRPTLLHKDFSAKIP